MSYVDAWFDRKNDEIQVAERIDGERVITTLPANYVFYYEDPKGKSRSIYGDKVTKFKTTSYGRFKKEVAVMRGRKIFESDTNVLFRTLADNYLDKESPKLNIGLFDIEVDFDPEKGFPHPEDALAAVNAISIHLSWVDQMFTLALKPKTLSNEQAEHICSKFDNCFLFTEEEELLKTFLDLIEDVDVLSGWNSTFFDIPYLVTRITNVLGSAYVKKLCLWGLKPQKKMVEKFKKEHLTYDLTGRVHLDYLELFKKHSMQEYHSYSLDFVGDAEVGVKKLQYEGTLDKLYTDDFETFIKYNIIDVDILVKIDKKNSYIDLANQVAHTNSVLLKTTMGSVALIDQAIINEAHRLGMVVHDKSRTEHEHMPVAGAYVANPVTGIHEEIAAIDINSLYPSVIRSLNMCNETIVGQIRLDQTKKYLMDKVEEGCTDTEAWHDQFGALEYFQISNREDTELILDLEDGTSRHASAKDLHSFIFNEDNNYCISANGTIFRTDIEGVIPSLLSKWYSERQDMQFTKGVWYKSTEGISEDDTKILEGALSIIGEDNLIYSGGKYTVKDVEHAKSQVSFWDKRQYVRKILLNSLYGALLNPACRFYDPRMGQSVTLTGRSITKHMISKINQLLIGEYKHEGGAIIYGDTDSCYFSAAHLLKADPEYKEGDFDKETAIELYDSLSEATNETFPTFMMASFNTSKERGEIIAAGREVVASKGLFIKKKRYALMVYDKEGERLDVDGKLGKIKAMGLDQKRSDTPQAIQKFLEHVLDMILSGKPEKEILDYISTFRQDEFRTWDSWDKGTPTGVNGLTRYNDLLVKAKGRKVNMPGHVRAAINWNKLRKINDDKFSLEINDGAKVIVCKLKSNPMKMTSIAYPRDEQHLPDWFKDLPFDDKLMEAGVVDKKLENLMWVLDWDLKSTKNESNFKSLFKKR